LTAPESWESTRKYAYAEHKVVQDRPRLQWMAQELEEIGFELMLHVGFTNPQRQLAALVAAAEDHRARALVMGTGLHRGFLVVGAGGGTHPLWAPDGGLIGATANPAWRESGRGGEVPAAPPRPQNPPPGLVAKQAAPAGASSKAAPAPFNPTQPIGPHNL